MLSPLQIAMFYADEDLPDHYTLTDVAALYGWRRVRSVLFTFVGNLKKKDYTTSQKSPTLSLSVSSPKTVNQNSSTGTFYGTFATPLLNIYHSLKGK